MAEGLHQVKTSMDNAPVVIFWELTRACALVCRHCRANAQPRAHPLELTTKECFSVLEGLASFDRPPIVVMSGGDPFMRRDLFDLVGYGKGKGLRVSLSPSATALVTEERLSRLKEAGVSSISFSLDGSRPEVHDPFRGVPGSFERTLRCISQAIKVGLSLQINTVVSRWNKDDLPSLEQVVASTGAPLWDLFFLVPVGRALEGDLLSPQEHEDVFHWLYGLEARAPFRIKTTLGQPYRRVWIQRRLREAGRTWCGLSPEGVLGLWQGGAPSNDGKGILFISHVGAVYPSGFLPVEAGNVRRDSIVDLYRESPIFKSLRDPEQLRGKCSRCPFRLVCGGCRARAYALTGDYLAADPTCPFDPS